MTASNGAYLLGYVCVWLHTTVIFCSRKEIPHPRNVDLLFLIWKSLFPCVNLVGVLVVCWLHSPNLPECFVTHRVTAKRGFAVKIIPSSPLLWIGMENWALFSTSWKSKASVCSVQRGLPATTGAPVWLSSLRDCRTPDDSGQSLFLDRIRKLQMLLQDISWRTVFSNLSESSELLGRLLGNCP